MAGPGTNNMNRLIQDCIDAVDSSFCVGKGAEAHVHGAQAHGKAPYHSVHCRQDGAARSAVAKRWGGTPAVLDHGDHGAQAMVAQMLPEM